MSWSMAATAARQAYEQMGELFWLRTLSDVDHHPTLKVLIHIARLHEILAQEFDVNLYSALDRRPIDVIYVMGRFVHQEPEESFQLAIRMNQEISGKPPQAPLASYPWFYRTITAIVSQHAACGIDYELAQALAVHDRLTRTTGMGLPECCRIVGIDAMYAMVPLLAMADSARFESLAGNVVASCV